MKSWLLVIFSLSLWLAANTASFACPCGCSALGAYQAAGPLSMQYGEKWRFQSLLIRSHHELAIDKNGEAADLAGPMLTDTLTLGGARSLTEKLAISGQLAVERHWHQSSGSDTALGDPAIALSYLALPQQTQVYIPKIQLHLTYKHAIAKGITQAARKEHLLDIHGNGASELAPAIDLWFGTERWTVGIGESFYLRQKISYFDGISQRQKQLGSSHKTTLSAGYTVLGAGQLVASLDREQKSPDKLDGLSQASSDALRHTLTLLVHTRIGIQKTFSFGIRRIGFLLANRNVEKQQSLLFGFTQAL